MRLVLGHEEIMGPWAAQRIPHMFLEALGPFRSIGVVDAGDALRAAALFHGYAPQYQSIEISFAMDGGRWLTRSMIAGIMAYPFSQLHCGRVTAVTPRSSASARRFLETFGFRREGVARRGFGTFGDAVIYGLTANDWSNSRFGPGRGLNVQEKHPHAAAGA